MELKKLLDVMKRLALIAGEEILKQYNQEIQVEYKEDHSPVTTADKAANEIIVTGLKSAFPGIPVLAEESADDLSRLGQRTCFIVDPLDGTREFIKKNGEFTVNIALAENGKPTAGVIYVPDFYICLGLNEDRTEILKVWAFEGDAMILPLRGINITNSVNGLASVKEYEIDPVLFNEIYKNIKLTDLPEFRNWESINNN